MKEQDLIAKLNERVHVNGIAQNVQLGAVVMTEELTPIFLDNVKKWDSEVKGKSVIVTGILRRKLLAPKATLASNGEISHGVEDGSYVLESSSWKNNE